MYKYKYYVINGYKDFKVVYKTNDEEVAYNAVYQIIRYTKGKCMVGIMDTDQPEQKEYLKKHGVI